METVDNMACASNRVFVGHMPTQLKSIIQKFVPERRTYMVGAAFVRGCPTLHDDTASLAELAKLANALLRREWDVTTKNFKWNTIQVVPAEDARSCSDANFTGMTVNVIVSDDASVSVLVKRG